MGTKKQLVILLILEFLPQHMGKKSHLAVQIARLVVAPQFRQAGKQLAPFQSYLPCLSILPVADVVHHQETIRMRQVVNLGFRFSSFQQLLRTECTFVCLLAQAQPAVQIAFGQQHAGKHDMIRNRSSILLALADVTGSLVQRKRKDRRLRQYHRYPTVQHGVRFYFYRMIGFLGTVQRPPKHRQTEISARTDILQLIRRVLCLLL